MTQNATQTSEATVLSFADPAPELEEILRLIFQFTEQASLSRAARVSRAWSNIALDELWRSLPSIFPLLKLLAPLEWILDPTKHQRTLCTSLVDADWDRFRGYALRVQCVNIDNALEVDLPHESAALVQMFHRTAPLLPNIETISWRFIQTKNCTSILPFIGPQLEHVTLVMERGINENEQRLLMRSLGNFVPNLRSLRLTSLTPTSDWTGFLAQSIYSWPKLVHLELPPFFLTPAVVAATASLPLLTKLNSSGWRSSYETYSTGGMNFKFTPGSFPKLDSLSFAALPNKMLQVLRSTDHVRQLQTICLDCPTFSGPWEIERVFTQLADVAQRLVDLQLVCSPVRQYRTSSSNDSLLIQTIRPLFSCTRLRRFHLVAPRFEPLTDADIVEMGKSWPAMRCLTLSPAPVADHPSGTPFSTLPAFAKNLPNLQKLRLLFDTETSEFDGNLYPTHRFKKLEVLGVGFSSVPRGKAQEIGFLLASLCQTAPAIEVGITKYHRGDDIPEPRRSELLVEWLEVGSAMDLAFRTKKSITPLLRTTGAEQGEPAL
ncbi:hypothetical protein FRC01_006612 [Tulasnella sp. 417]|nr:hypothetical protein FRC01_006612 [Tulasnella sp. 417]